MAQPRRTDGIDPIERPQQDESDVVNESWDGNPAELLLFGNGPDEQREAILTQIGFTDLQTATQRMLKICENDEQRRTLESCFNNFLYSLSESANPDQSLLNFERYLQRYDDRAELLNFLAANPRAVEILMRLFVGSQFLTEILLRNPGYLEDLTNHKRLADFKSRSDFYEEAQNYTQNETDFYGRIAALRHYQHWELLRIGACDSFGLMDFKSITLQLSLLADALVQICLKFAAEKENLPTDEFVVLAFGKLGGEEINYSSDIDLVFVALNDASRYWPLGQTLIEAITKATADGFLYRVDMRLRPWGRSGALVCSEDAYEGYLKKHGMLWEKQALLKARPIAGNLEVGERFLKRIEPIVFDSAPEDVRKNVLEMKRNIERELQKQGRRYGEVKGGKGSIRDIEFCVQYLQLIAGRDDPTVRSINTLDGLVRLVEHKLIKVDEFRHLSDGYVFLRTIEHALQLTHYKQIHHIPSEPRELAYLARKLDFPDSETFKSYYERHSASIRRIYEKYLEKPYADVETEIAFARPLLELVAEAQPDYASTFSETEIQLHAQLIDKLPDGEFIHIATHRLSDKSWRLIVVGKDLVGQFSVTCGLLFANGFDIVRGHVFTGLFPTEYSRESSGEKYRDAHSRFVTVLEVEAHDAETDEKVWQKYLAECREISHMLHRGQIRDVQGILARRVGKALENKPNPSRSLLPVELQIRNDVDENATAIDISGEDVPGFLYGLTTGLALSGVQLTRVIIDSAEGRVRDRLYVQSLGGEKIEDEGKLQLLRTAIVLIKHIAHILPTASNPESALLHFRDLLEKLFDQPDWADQLSSLERPSVLDALVKVLGVSDFLWEDFLRLQYANLFPVVTDIDSLKIAKGQPELESELRRQLKGIKSLDEQIEILNAFKDRELVRSDMRHILEYNTTFGEFSIELTNIAEVVTRQAVEIAYENLKREHGEPLLPDGSPCRYCVAALGKGGGRELGFASDIELMFIFEDKGVTNGVSSITAVEFYSRLVKDFRSMIRAKSDGIFEIDLRLRPYGNAGSLAVSLEAFENYFGPEGAAWPYERQSLVKLRPIVGFDSFSETVVALRDRLVYTGQPFDVTAMRGMREKQVRQLVQPGTINAKLSPGGLVDCEYLVQGLQISHGYQHPSLRTTNTREALRQLEAVGVLTSEERIKLRDCYRFLRNLIDALRMVRGNAGELTVPSPGTDEFDYLARRMGYAGRSEDLQSELQDVMSTVLEMSSLLDQTGKE